MLNAIDIKIKEMAYKIKKSTADVFLQWSFIAEVSAKFFIYFFKDFCLIQGLERNDEIRLIYVNLLFTSEVKLRKFT